MNARIQFVDRVGINDYPDRADPSGLLPRGQRRRQRCGTDPTPVFACFNGPFDSENTSTTRQRVCRVSSQFCVVSLCNSLTICNQNAAKFPYSRGVLGSRRPSPLGDPLAAETRALRGVGDGKVTPFTD